MRTIKKGVEPASLTQHRLTGHADYENYADKDGLRRQLVREQRGLCCYCLSRIRPVADAMKIEHWHSQDGFPDEQLDYSNLLGACLGGAGQPNVLQHCDTKKGNSTVSKNPAEPARRVETFLHYEGDGRIVSDDTSLNSELENVLNLNTAFLKNNRKATLDGFHRALRKRGEIQRITLERWLRDWNGDSDENELRPFCQVVVYWLRKRLAHA
ncbi:MAG: retron system putative HNH endonuclease [Limisphaerales bacterium]